MRPGGASAWASATGASTPGLVLIFAAVYAAVPASSYDTSAGYGAPPRGVDTIAFSIVAFHGRGVVNGDVYAGSHLLWVPALEAMIGLFVEAVFVAVLIRWLFRE
jgi:hypothetical protein